MVGYTVTGTGQLVCRANLCVGCVMRVESVTEEYPVPNTVYPVPFTHLRRASRTPEPTPLVTQYRRRQSYPIRYCAPTDPFPDNSSFAES
jgi:hypothetical protein